MDEDRDLPPGSSETVERLTPTTRLILLESNVRYLYRRATKIEELVSTLDGKFDLYVVAQAKTQDSLTGKINQVLLAIFVAAISVSLSFILSHAFVAGPIK